MTKSIDKTNTKLEQAVLSGKGTKPDIVVSRVGEDGSEIFYFDPKIGGFIGR